MQVIGGGSFARECYLASVTATLSGTAGHADIESCNQALSHGGLRKRDKVATYVNRGVLHVAMENYQHAAKDYNRAIKMDPGVAEAYVNRGNLWFLVNHFDKAIVDYDRSLELGFGRPHVALLNRGMAYENTGKFVDARKDYVAALALVAGWAPALQKLDRVNKKIK